MFSFPDWSTQQDDKELERLEKRRAAQRRYRESHKEQIKAAARRYRETNKEKISEYARRKWRTDPAIARNTGCGTGDRSAGWCSKESTGSPWRTTT